jgi:hypothetical protein
MHGAYFHFPIPLHVVVFNYTQVQLYILLLLERYAVSTWICSWWLYISHNRISCLVQYRPLRRGWAIQFSAGQFGLISLLSLPLHRLRVAFPNTFINQAFSYNCMRHLLLTFVWWLNTRIWLNVIQFHVFECRLWLFYIALDSFQ